VLVSCLVLMLAICLRRLTITIVATSALTSSSCSSLCTLLESRAQCRIHGFAARMHSSSCCWRELACGTDMAQSMPSYHKMSLAPIKQRRKNSFCNTSCTPHTPKHSLIQTPVIGPTWAIRWQSHVAQQAATEDVECLHASGMHSINAMHLCCSSCFHNAAMSEQQGSGIASPKSLPVRHCCVIAATPVCVFVTGCPNMAKQHSRSQTPKNTTIAQESPYHCCICKQMLW
jgi:hypothetical protein